MTNQNKKHRRLKKPVKVILILSSLLLTVCLSIGTTYAYLLSRSETVTNTFTPGTAGNTIDESFNGTLKENVKVKNTGNINAFIRATIVITWQNKKGEVYPVLPVKGTDYAITLNPDNGWFENNGIYYCKTEVAPGASTPVLIKECTQEITNAPKGYGLNVEILSSSIQSLPRSAVQEAWGIYASANGELSLTPTGGTN